VEGLLHEVLKGNDPDHPAVTYQGTELDYAALERRSNGLAAELYAAGIGPGKIVGLLLAPGMELPVAQLAVLKSGAAWTMLDPQLPPARLAYQAADAAAALVLTTRGLAAAAPAGIPHRLLDDPAEAHGEADSPPEVDVRPTDTAYLLYTSGSTGTPKGILVSHASAYTFCHSAVDLFDTTPADRVAQVANPAFDASVFDLYMTWMAGATLVCAARETVADPEALMALLLDERITLTYLPPALLAVLDPDRLAGSALRAAFSAGEALPPEQVERWSRIGLELHNSYGATETTVFATDYRCPPGAASGPVPIGTALPEHRTYVLDDRLRPVPVGVPGQVYISGTGVSFGYVNRPALTARAFLPAFYDSVPGARMYATGDLGRWRADGVLEFLGRRDRQVKLRGQRVELGEIEHVLARFPGVRHCTVQVHRDQLAAYLVGEYELGALRAYLAERLPTYMIPTAYVPLAELPVSPSGKLDTARLPDPEAAAREYAPPRSETERWIAETWANLLEAERVGVADDFFELGGNSLLAIRFAARAGEQLQVELAPSALFTHPVLGVLAELIDETRREAVIEYTVPEPAAEAPDDELDEEILALERLLKAKRAKRAATRPVRQADRDEPLRCTHQQEGLWFEHQLDPSSAAYHVPVALRLRGPLDVPALERALTALVVRHEALRTRFVALDGEPRQVVDPPPDRLPLERAQVARPALQEWIRELIVRPMDLAAGPLFHCALAQTAPDEHALVLVAHHIISDGWSTGILADELTKLYVGEAGMLRIPLPHLQIQPADHAEWIRDRLDGGERERQLEYWRTALAGLPALDLPTDRPRPPRPTGAGAHVRVPLPADLSAEAARYAQTNRFSLLGVLQAALLTVLHRYTGQTDLPIGSVFSGRTRTETEPLVGYFVNSLVLRTRLDDAPTFAQLVRRCTETVLDASANQDVPFGMVVDALAPERVAGRNPLFQISLILQPALGGAGGGSGTSLGTVGVEPIGISTGYSRFDLSLEVAQAPDGGLSLAAEYSTELFDAERITRLLEHFTAALAGGLRAPETEVAALEFVSAAERDLVVRTWNPKSPPLVPGLLHEVTAGHRPQNTAIEFPTGALSYGELELRANRLANALRAHGIGRGNVVCILLDRGLDLPVAQFAVMKAGAAWSMLDPQLPAARLAFQTEDSGAPLILTTSDLAHLAPESADHWLLDDPARRAHLDAQPDTVPSTGVGPEDPAYLLYTSGSTGRPKGVLVSHRAARAYGSIAVGLLGIGEADRVAQIANPAFDVSVFDCFATLLGGATLVGASRETIADPDELTGLLLRERITLSYLPPALLGVLDPDRLADSALRAVFSAGETLPADQAARWVRPGFELHNSYGPTETTVVCTDYLCPETLPPGPTPIGTALPYHRAYVLDDRLRPQPPGIPGQLFIAGSGLAHGYLNRTALTAQFFLPDPYSPVPGERMYATGDLARWRSDGLIEFLGRRDRQVKLRGQRIELGDIEHALAGHPRVRQSVVLLHGSRLAGYVVGDPDPDELRAYLAARLPLYMVPSALMVLPELPVTLNGKLDTARLPEPEGAAPFLEARTDTERWLAEIWRDLLDADQIGALDSFFELGGNSLHTTRLTARISDRFEVQLHPRVLFANPVLEQLATRIDEARAGADASADTGAVAFRTAGTRAPLILVHPAGGSVAPYAPLVPLLGADQPVYAIEDPGLQGGETAVDLPGQARRYAELVRSVHPDGPYLLGGWSFGGAVALEIARLLTEAGAEVESVVMIDTMLPKTWGEESYRGLLQLFILDLAGMAGPAAPQFAPPDGLDPEALEEAAGETIAKAGLAPGMPLEELRVRMRVYAANMRAVRPYRPERYEGRVVLIRAADNPVVGDEVYEAWHRACPLLEQRTVPGDHHSLLLPPRLAGLAAALNQALRQAAPGSGDKTRDLG